MSFGNVIAEARKHADMSLKELSLLIKKEDGQPISPQYLNDIEHDRRNPPSEFILRQLASALNIPIEVLYYNAGEIPPELRGMPVDNDQVLEAYKAFRQNLQKK